MSKIGLYFPLIVSVGFSIFFWMFHFSYWFSSFLGTIERRCIESVEKEFFFFLIFRSSVDKREQPSQNTYPYRLKCVIYDKVQDKGISTKYRVSEKSRAKNLMEAAFFLQDDVYMKISDLDTPQKVFGADVF